MLVGWLVGRSTTTVTGSATAAAVCNDRRPLLAGLTRFCCSMSIRAYDKIAFTRMRELIGLKTVCVFAHVWDKQPAKRRCQPRAGAFQDHVCETASA